MGSLEAAFGRILHALAVLSGLVLLLMMLGTVADVVMRYVFNAPFRGSLELTEFAMSLIVFLAMAHCGWTGGHIAVDLLERWLDRPWLRFLPALLSIIGAALFAVMTYQVAVEALATTSKVSNMMRIPHYPFKLAVAFGAAMFSLTLLLEAIKAMRGRPA